jgi:hypothetical protein
VDQAPEAERAPAAKRPPEERASDAEREPNADRSAHSRASGMRGWLQTLEQHLPSNDGDDADGTPAPKTGRDASRASAAETDVQTVILPKLSSSRPAAPNGAAAAEAHAAPAAETDPPTVEMPKLSGTRPSEQNEAGAASAGAAPQDGAAAAEAHATADAVTEADAVTDAQAVTLLKLPSRQTRAQSRPTAAAADSAPAAAEAARDGSAAAETDSAQVIEFPGARPEPGDADRGAAAGVTLAAEGGTTQDDSTAEVRPGFRGWFQPRKQSRPVSANGAPSDQPAPRKARSSQFGTAPAVRPDVLTDAETIVLPALEKSRGTLPKGSPQPGVLSTQVPAEAAGAERGQAGGTAAPAAPTYVLAEAVTQTLAAIEAPAEADRAAPRRAHRLQRWIRAAVPRQLDYKPVELYVPTRRRTMISRTILLGVLCMQAIMSLRLRNTAFQNEALYLYSGRLELEHLLHGASLYGNFSSYFPGSPVLYPVAAAALNDVGGLAMARALSLVEMLATTAMLYSIARRLFNERAALCAVALFSVSQTVLFLGNFSTGDATCLFLLAAAAWIMVYSARSQWPFFFLAVPVAVLAVAVEYAGVVWVPTIAVLPPLVAGPYRIRRAWWSPICFLVAVGDLLFAALRLGGPAYVTAVMSTTTNPGQGPIPVAAILTDSLKWGGLLFALAVIGSVAYVHRVRTDPDELVAPAGSRLRRAALGLILTGSALLAPAYAAYLHTDTSFQERIGFGLFFAAPMAGLGLARIMGDHFRWPHFAVAIWSLALVLGLTQSNSLYHEWPSSGTFVSAFSRYLKPDARYLVEVPEVPIYYLENRSDAQPKQFTATYSVAPLSTPTAFATAVEDKEFQVIAYNGDVTAANDNALAKALKASHSYHLASKVYIGYAYGSSTYYYIWVEDTATKAASATGRTHAK